MKHAWEERNRPIRLERRLEFETYSATRDFLDRLGSLSEDKQRFPDISFGRTYVNITLRPLDESEGACLQADDHAFAAGVDELLD
ncbi:MULTISPECIES: 4a-hydroxytetrahydrobiopterin dehydratase [unclassified Synechococcus]|uniref:4a-hydroxytetrahydrobiopterin dehydratase n=1 Tax=unclassified Synechococcus TaxID=2626047 RepID=UPI000E0E8A76|nr:MULTISPECIES: 4a-hydroxytetrahydrobiopterin dehydratase [unclassified Synechococcus]RZO15485.1 MAG: 4a-hydroxytetrahydrobiopterin dehydratase [Synechococcus sp. MED-G135]